MRLGALLRRSLAAACPLGERDALRAFLARLNDDHRARAPSTPDHGGEITHDHKNLNCAKSVGAAFRHGAGYDMLQLRDPPQPCAALPDRFPSVLSLDFRADAAHCEDEHTLYAMYLLRSLSRCALQIDADAQSLQVLPHAQALPGAQAARQAREAAHSESRNVLRRLPAGVRSAAGCVGPAHLAHDFGSPRPAP